ncbi:40S ribosomal protein S4, X isoform [Tritrichomonas foetus]|uniref:40S ribosomal protein S4 n=1 Tax=Tritrichomonas foetus TaxID=1144522 RepID=A0A1J4KHW1_9EUKA|nr:40S ribosomal protein S4, X isoform [Tritrichomonas foetus]OHT10977.1 40S ribosomal protein S4, X isoform [Tritrichomonas foetus]|eukprot:OHT10977.1 40S ribosomal protein S4, X isoform [Tritrichomonas foetus]
MPRCQRKHLKCIAAPHHWMLAKTSGKFASTPSSGPHKARECLPLIVFLRNRLKYALNSREVTAIVKRRLVKVDGKVRVDPRFPAGLMDVIELGKSNEQFRLLYDCKGRYVAHKIEPKEAEFKLLRVNKYFLGPQGVAHLVTHDGRTIRYADPKIKLNDTVKFNLKNHEVESFIKFANGNVAMVTAGGNVGRVGVIQHIEHQTASFDIVHIKDASGSNFATRIANVFIIGDGENPLISLPRRNGVRPSILEGIDIEAAQ